MGDEEWEKLHIDQKCEHKLWKARQAGYTEALKLFNQLPDGKSTEFTKFVPLIKKFVGDSNAVSQLKGLEAALAFVENANIAVKVVGEVMVAVVNKALNQPKARARDLGASIALAYIEAERPEPVLEELMKGIDNKNPKVVTACLVVLRSALCEFGTKVVQLKPMVKALPRLFESRDKVVRDEAKLLAVEAFRWIRDAIRPALQCSLTPVQLKDLEEEFEKLGSTPARPTRFLRSQQAARAKDEEKHAESIVGTVERVVCDSAAVDPYDMLEPFALLSKLPKDFFTKIEAKKWQERKEALEILESLVKNPRLEPGDYGELVRALKKVIVKDSNVMLVALAAKCLACLAAGLRKKFHPYVGPVVSALLEKFKEKKVNVVQALQEAIDAVFLTTTLAAMSEDILSVMDSKNPNVKQQTSLFLARSFRYCTPATLPKAQLKPFCICLLKQVGEPAPEVRDAAYEALGTALKVVGDRLMGPFLSDVDKLKLEKIKECAERVELVSGGGKVQTVAHKVHGAKVAVNIDGGKTAKAAKLASSTKSGGPGPSKKSGGGGLKKSGGVSVKPKKATEVKEEINEPELSLEECEAKAAAVISASCIQQLESNNWKERVASMEGFIKAVEDTDQANMPCQALVRILAKKPGWKDNNFQVMQLKVRAAGLVAQKGSFSKTSGRIVLEGLPEKLGDAKSGVHARESLCFVASACGLPWTAEEVFNSVFSQKNPKNQAEALSWLSSAIKDFGFSGFNVKFFLTHIKAALAAQNPDNQHVSMWEDSHLKFNNMHIGYRKAENMPFCGILVKFLQELLEPGVNGASSRLDLCNDFFFNISHPVSPPPTPIHNSSKITSELVTKLSDKNWKIRKEGLDEVLVILNEAKFITPAIGELAAALRMRLSDSNKMLVQQVLGILQQLATAMGPGIRQHIKSLGFSMVSSLGDSKNTIRAAALSALNAWVDQTGLKDWLEGDDMSEELKKENPFLRQELLGWLAEKLPCLRTVPSDLALCLPYLYACLEDRNGEVRCKAHSAVPVFMMHLGYERMAKGTANLKISYKDSVVSVLEKVRATIPAKPNKTATTKESSALVSTSSHPAEECPPAHVKKAKNVGVKNKTVKKPAAKAIKDEEDQSGKIFTVVPLGKEQRIKEDKSLKLIRWNFTNPRDEHTEQLHTQMGPCVARWLQDELFHSDVQHRIKALSVLTEHLDAELDGLISCLDLVVKWLTLRFFESNTTILMRTLEYLKLLFLALGSANYHLLDYEAQAFVPYLVLKVGEAKDGIRKDVRTIMNLLCKVYPASKMFAFTIEGVKSKNSKQRAECLEELGLLIQNYGMNICQPSPARALREMAGAIGDRDTTVRNAALNAIVVAYNLAGDQALKMIGSISEKDMSMLEERIKRSAKKGGARPVETCPPASLNTTITQGPNTTGSVATGVKINHTFGAQQTPGNQPPLSREFQLELDDIEDEHVVSEMPVLVNCQLDDDILAVPHDIPQLRTTTISTPLDELGGIGADSTLAFVISQVANRNIDVAIEALAQLDELLRTKKRSHAISGNVDQLLLVTFMQLRLASNTHLSDPGTPTKHVLNLYNCLVSNLVSLFKSGLGKEGSADMLKDLLNALLLLLPDPRIEEMEEGPQLLRSINLLLGQMLEHSDPAAIISAMIRLLHDCVNSPTNNSKYAELVMKCLWRISRLLPGMTHNVKVDRVLLDAHNFLRVYPKDAGRDRKDDLPLRTMKTLLYMLGKLQGPEILEHLGLIENRSESQLEAYLRKVTRNLYRGKADEEKEHNCGRKDEAAHLAKMNDDVAEIFKKIGSKENTREGLSELYDFKCRNPEADLEPFLQRASVMFQRYVEHGLNAIQIERDCVAQLANVHTSNGGLSHTATSSVTKEDVKAYVERCRMLRQQVGVEIPKDTSLMIGLSRPVSASHSSVPRSSVSSVLPTAPETLGSSLPHIAEPEGVSSSPHPHIDTRNLEDLQKRLDNIKSNKK
uniref:LOW QUALITY PROTEIN: cytoskeleton-associated protein 5-like n=1 Tax=Myxine glutinosa TaxID=7769 RepID=UPI00358F8D0F